MKTLARTYFGSDNDRLWSLHNIHKFLQHTYLHFHMSQMHTGELQHRKTLRKKKKKEEKMHDIIFPSRTKLFQKDAVYRLSIWTGVRIGSRFRI